MTISHAIINHIIMCIHILTRSVLRPYLYFAGPSLTLSYFLELRCFELLFRSYMQEIASIMMIYSRFVLNWNCRFPSILCLASNWWWKMIPFWQWTRFVCFSGAIVSFSYLSASMSCQRCRFYGHQWILVFLTLVSR